MRRVFLLDATARQKNEVRLLLIDEDGEKCLLTFATERRTIYVVPSEAITDDWIECVLNLLQRFSGGMPRDFAHAVVKRRYMSQGMLSQPTDVLRVRCSGHLEFSARAHERVLHFFGLSTPLLEHLLVENQLHGWLFFDEKGPGVKRVRRKLFTATDAHSCLRRCTDQGPPPRLRVAAVYRHDMSTFTVSVRDGQSREHVSADGVVAFLTQQDPAVVCVHNKNTLVGVELNFPFVVVDTAAFALDHKLCFSRNLDDVAPLVHDYPVVDVLDDGEESVSETFICEEVRNGRERCDAIFSIIDRTNAIALTLEIATITGQPWSQTLRLESKLGRVEWMIMNLFHRCECVVPDPRRYTTPQQYTAGLVLDARVGVHKNVALLDFRSLYPSVVVEHRLCWSADGSVLPSMLEYLIDHRRQLVSVEGTEITRLGLKLLANTTYGALAYPAFRFYSPDIAATITAYGRQALQDAVQTVETRFAGTVIYGDTDSVFVTVDGDVDAAAREIVAEVSSAYTKLELEFEAIYDHLFLLGKKCYVAFERGHVEPVLKGLMMVKKQYFGAGKKLCRRMIDMMHDDQQSITEAVYALAQQFVADLNEKRVELADLVVVNQLSRRLVDYATVANPGYHVVAAKTSRLPYDRGDYVRYVMFTGCTPVVVETIDKDMPLELDVKWYCVRLYGMIEQIARVIPDYDLAPLSQLLQHGDIHEAPAVDDAPCEVRARQPLIVQCVACRHDIEHWGLAKLEDYLVARKCDGIDHLSPRCVLPDTPISASMLFACSNCSCEIDVLAAARQEHDLDHAACLHANYDCRRVARQLDCRTCRYALMQFFQTSGVLARFTAIQEAVFTW